MIPDWSRATVLDAAAFEACWEILGLGETPWQLDPPRRGRTAAERQAFVATVSAQLHAAGPQLSRQLGLLARPAWSLDVRLRADTLIAGLAACRGRDGVLAVRNGAEIGIVEIAAADAVAAVLGLLGPVHPGPGPAVLVSTTDAGRPVDDVRVLGPGPAVLVSMTGAGCPVDDLRMLGQFGASAAGREGRGMRRIPHVIGFHRTGRGDYRSVRVDPATAGPTTASLEPTTHARLARDLDGLLVGVR